MLKRRKLPSVTDNIAKRKQLRVLQGFRWPEIKEKPDAAEAVIAVRTLLKYIGEDPDRPGLLDTPLRVIKAWKHDWGLGYDTAFVKNQTTSIFRGQFDDGAENYNQMIAVRKIRFTSHCEHHMAEFSGTVDIAYIPRRKGSVLGLSKLVRIVELYSKRLQIQERLTNQIADFLDNNLKPSGVGVIVRATHSCMCSRGVHQYEPIAVTSALRGEMMTEPEVRAEFLQLVRQ